MMLRLQTLGELQLEGADASHLSSRRKELPLLAYLARRGGRPVSRAEAATLFWEDRDERRARQSLRQALSELRRLVGDALPLDAEQITLREGALSLDVGELERALAAGRYAEAVRLWTGEFLPGIEEIGGEELRGWLEVEREGAPAAGCAPPWSSSRRRPGAGGAPGGRASSGPSAGSRACRSISRAIFGCCGSWHLERPRGGGAGAVLPAAGPTRGRGA